MVMVSSTIVTVTTPSTVNCVKGGSSDPLLVSTTAVPVGTLSVAAKN